jgi:hypothetical protein
VSVQPRANLSAFAFVGGDLTVASQRLASQLHGVGVAWANTVQCSRSREPDLGYFSRIE